MPSELETKQNNVRIKFILLKERFNLINVPFEGEEIVNSMMSTEQGCDILTSHFEALDQSLDQIWSSKPPNSKPGNNFLL